MEHAELAQELVNDFRDQHRKICAMLIKLEGSLKAKNVRDAREILGKINNMSGPHIRFEEECFYPELKRIMGDYIDRFYMENDMLIHTVRSFFSLLEKGTLTDQEVFQSVDAVRMLLVHVCNSEGLLVLCEMLEKKVIERLTEKSDACKKDGVPMLKWADTMREVRRVA
ncbi:MAG: hemerythrin domain-containing protein [Deltaproteobacteria bacterium]|nr:hemerythrin domain-containing protein [Deltaproteobacteria bacterium]NIS77174.1 hemerythrin domain-containing protein [Deltaproteobacteria bacterium]